MTYSIEIPMTNSGFSMMTSSMKVYPTDFDNERLSEIAGSSSKRLHCHFRLAFFVEIARGQFVRARRGRKPHSRRWNCHPICHSSRDL